MSAEVHSSSEANSPRMHLLTKGADLLGIPLAEHQIDLFQTYAEELVDWNRKVNLTAITGYEDIQTKHFVDSLTCFLAFPGVARRDHPPLIGSIPPLAGIRVIDVGTGGGFPGLPLKIARPEISLTLLDSVAKKTRFLEHVVQKLGLTWVDVVTGRAEEIARDPLHRERYDVVVSRAVAELATLMEYCLPLAKIGGRAIALKKGALEEELRTGQKAINLLGGRFGEMIPVELPGLLELRYAITAEKVAPTPASYPRRPGVPAKKPL
ncbi:MAG: 16S rRNA (guanine(527)-N(7))-methyltransferase RsmG [Dehalococcoidales bacterium]|nr:16S rRNA (guanine(527)-N(7))-methyltransferase RsmG [Dehalococcoidales bacterium]